ncbi:hypothetical protein DY000_02021529 [Brassica cretica]|uniref:Uncharacterized protein n=1 Tax=Brassica cretica TaxID=69181 RepID=A0ABQ7E506_BRACR|nr:hypothetical protein DY000_02021529 [Brassica cretica]
MRRRVHRFLNGTSGTLVSSETSGSSIILEVFIGIFTRFDIAGWKKPRHAVEDILELTCLIWRLDAKPSSSCFLESCSGKDYIFII